jgi:hypothetical protein
MSSSPQAYAASAPQPANLLHPFSLNVAHPPSQGASVNKASAIRVTALGIAKCRPIWLARVASGVDVSAGAAPPQF